MLDKIKQESEKEFQKEFRDDETIGSEDAKNITDFWLSKLDLAYEAGQEEGEKEAALDNTLDSWVEHKIEQARHAERKEIVEEISAMECTIKKNHPEHCHFPIALDEVLKLLKE